ncbi:E3 ubiquitin-protein ligase TRAIP-like [Trichogramma pretiosum]|uniref:E3 ubiquitin-protein ligase TRAIP-like n=1 Tax=Trichogramma pretiosum TaxID=7493 RepID=UPI000C71B35E|nr:E3 ubiquitin-protein ligase TRAIP-like [Trichogramma pretiosum]
MYRPQCGICQEFIDDNSVLFTIPCGHIQHHHCLLRVLSDSQTCPICRQKASQLDAKKVFLNFSAIHDDEESPRIKKLRKKNMNLLARLRSTELDHENCRVKLEEARRYAKVLEKDYWIASAKEIKSTRALLEAKKRIQNLQLKNSELQKESTNEREKFIETIKKLEEWKQNTYWVAIGFHTCLLIIMLIDQLGGIEYFGISKSTFLSNLVFLIIIVSSTLIVDGFQ